MRWVIGLIYLLIATLSHAETLIVGIPPFIPPFVMRADNNEKYTGFSIDIIQAACKHMHTECLMKRFAFEQTFDEIIKNHVDLAIGNITITPERQQYVQFSIPYLTSNVEYLTLNNKSLFSISSLRGKNIGAEAGTLFVDFVSKQLGSETKVVTYQHTEDMIDALNNGDIDAVILDKQSADYWYYSNSTTLKIIPPSFAVGLGLGIITNKLNSALIARVNKALLAMQADGTYLSIYRTYFGDTGLDSINSDTRLTN